MKKIIIAPDSFKGSMSANRVCEIIGEEAKKAFPGAEIKKIPVADGGEGTVDAYLAVFGGRKITASAQSPLGRAISAYYAMLPDGTAVVETAQASGLTIEEKNNALAASSFGTGQLIKHALENGARKIILGLGGSAMTDGGAGCVSALGGRFLDKNGKAIPPGGEGLNVLETISLEGLDKSLKTTPLTVLCDVKNPLFGKNGAAYVYAPQKGADEKNVETLDAGLRRLAEKASVTLGADHSSEAGAGAAGGLGFACIAFLGGRLESGIDCILDAAGFEKEAADADLIITGEGKTDAQSLMGKVPFGVAKRANGARVVAVCGVNQADADQARKLGITKIYETDPLHRPFEEVRPFVEEDLRKTAEALFQSLKQKS